MHVEITPDLKLSKIDHLFVLVPEKTAPVLPDGIGKIAADVIERAAFDGRSDETITVLHEQPRKVTLVGLGKEVSIRGMRTALATVAKIAQKQRDARIGVAIG